jgi:hypothetical protein
VTRRQREAIARQERQRHERTCTGIRLFGYHTTVAGEQARVLCGKRCTCPKGRYIEDTALSEAVTEAAKRRGGNWISEAQLGAALCGPPADQDCAII